MKKHIRAGKSSVLSAKNGELTTQGCRKIRIRTGNIAVLSAKLEIKPLKTARKNRLEQEKHQLYL